MESEHEVIAVKDGIEEKLNVSEAEMSLIGCSIHDFNIEIDAFPPIRKEEQPRVADKVFQMLGTICASHHEHEEDYCLEGLSLVAEYLGEQAEKPCCVAYDNRANKAYLYLGWPMELAKMKAKLAMVTHVEHIVPNKD